MLNLIKRDLLLSFYSSANFFFTVSFFVLILILIPFAFGTQSDQLKLLFKGVVWIALAYQSSLQLIEFITLIMKMVI